MRSVLGLLRRTPSELPPWAPPVGWVRLGVAAGLVAPPLWVCGALGDTLVDRAFLRESAWSPVRRRELEWPSLLMLGPSGELMMATFALGGILVAGFGAALWRLAPEPPIRAAAALVGSAGVALGLLAFPPDRPGSTAGASWHDLIHDVAYPALLIACLLAAALLWAGGRRRAGWDRMARLSLWSIALGVPAALLTLVDAFGQLARYPLFVALVVWAEALAITALRETTRSRTARRAV